MINKTSYIQNLRLNCTFGCNEIKCILFHMQKTSFCKDFFHIRKYQKVLRNHIIGQGTFTTCLSCVLGKDVTYVRYTTFR